jgi:hypothetical protein
MTISQRILKNDREPPNLSQAQAFGGKSIGHQDMAHGVMDAPKVATELRSGFQPWEPKINGSP